MVLHLIKRVDINQKLKIYSEKYYEKIYEYSNSYNKSIGNKINVSGKAKWLIGSVSGNINYDYQKTLNKNDYMKEITKNVDITDMEYEIKLSDDECFVIGFIYDLYQIEHGDMILKFIVIQSEFMMKIKINEIKRKAQQNLLDSSWGEQSSPKPIVLKPDLTKIEEIRKRLYNNSNDWTNEANEWIKHNFPNAFWHYDFYKKVNKIMSDLLCSFIDPISEIDYLIDYCKDITYDSQSDRGGHIIVHELVPDLKRLKNGFNSIICF